MYEGSDRRLQSLYPASRCDRGKSRKVDEETILSLVKLRKEIPSLPVTRLLVEMEKRNLCPPDMTISQSTVYRILKREGLSGKPASGKVDRRRYEAEFPNDYCETITAEKEEYSWEEKAENENKPF